MAEYNVTAPDGTKYRVTGPEGASDEEVLSQIKAYKEPKKEAVATPKQESTTAGLIGGGFNKGLATLGGGLLDLGPNIGNMAVAGLGSVVGALGGKPPDLPFPMPGAGQQLIERGLQRGGMIPPTAKPQSPVDRYISSAAQALPSAILGRPTPAQIPRALTGAATSGIGAQAGADIAPRGYESLGSIIGSLLPGGPKRMATEAGAGERATAAKQAERFGQTKELGIPVPPRALKPDPVQQKIQNSLNKELGFPEGTDLNARQMRGYRGQLYDDAWAPIIAEPALQGKLIADPVFKREIQATAKEERRLRSEFSGSTPRPPNQQLALSDYTKPQFTVRGAMEKIQNLRQSASDNLASADAASKKLGRMQRGVADSMENLLKRNLKDVGKETLADDFEKSRVKMAQSHTIESAFDPMTGKIDPRRLAALETEGAPLSGDLKKIAQSTQAFPKAMKPGETDDSLLTKRMSPGSAMHPKSWVAHLLQQLTDPVTMSRPYQSTFVDPRAKLTPEQERVMRFIIGAQQGSQIPPPPQ